MLAIIAVTLVFALFVVLWFLPLQVQAILHQDGLEAFLTLKVGAPLVKVEKGISLGDKVRMALEHMWKRWRQTGEPVKIPLQKTIRRLPRNKLLGVLGHPLRYLARRAVCPRLEVVARVGGRDAMQSALLAGASWAAVGSGIGLLRQFIRIDPTTPKIAIYPDYYEPGWTLRANCILRLRLGHAVITGIWLLRRVLREPELKAWIRDSLRRKGEEGSGGASDSGSDENGHGKP